MLAVLKNAGNALKSLHGEKVEPPKLDAPAPTKLLTGPAQPVKK